MIFGGRGTILKRFGVNQTIASIHLLCFGRER